MNFGEDTVQSFTAIISIMHGSVVMRGPEAGLGTVFSLPRDLARRVSSGHLQNIKAGRYRGPVSSEESGV